MEQVNLVVAGFVTGAALAVVSVAVFRVLKQAREDREERFRSLETWLYKVDRNTALIDARLTSLEKGSK